MTLCRVVPCFTPLQEHGFRNLSAKELEEPQMRTAGGRYKRIWWVGGVPYMRRSDVGFIRLLGVHMMHRVRNPAPAWR